MTSTVLKRRFQNQLTKVSDYKQAVQLTVGQLASKTDHGFPCTEENAEPNQHWENAHLGSQNQHTVGKSTGILCWPAISVGPVNQPRKVILVKQVCISRVYLAYGLVNLELSPEKRLVFIKLANAFSLRCTEGRMLCRNTQETLSTHNCTRIYYTRIVYSRFEEHSCITFIFFFFPNQFFKSFDVW